MRLVDVGWRNRSIFLFAECLSFRKMRKSNRAAAMAMEAVFFLDRLVGLGCIHDKGGLSQTPVPYRRHVVG